MAKEIECTEKERIEFLDKIYGRVEICGIFYSSGQSLLEIDPDAFRESTNILENGVWECEECGERHYTKEDADECCEPKQETGSVVKTCKPAKWHNWDKLEAQGSSLEGYLALIKGEKK